MIVENEIKDHFGLRIDGLPLDFQGRLMLTDERLMGSGSVNSRC